MNPFYEPDELVLKEIREAVEVGLLHPEIIPGIPGTETNAYPGKVVVAIRQNPSGEGVQFGLKDIPLNDPSMMGYLPMRKDVDE